ncbi:MAG TPA: DCC1-like thiol-disulfide oxidoreductase family protein [Steroidobacteraceae bacterium]|nr:DCC1-like thiol-disulfide oxidoreductase family protein [Steroidobacteraceae bacterium]
MTRAVLYDGYCHSCSALVRFLKQRPTEPPFELIPMQGERGRALLAPFGIDPDDSSTFLVLDGDRAYTESDGVLHLARSLGPAWRALAAVGRFVPGSWRDGLYRLHARNRFRWFGRRATCYLP